MTAKTIALVTGGSRGIGAAIVQALREDGCEVLAPGRTELDLLNPASIEKYVRSVQGRGIGILVNNAGINFIQELEKLTDANWADTIQTNLTAPMKLAQGLAPGMKGRGWGRIVNVSSVFSLVTKEKRAAYSATKSGLNGLTRTLAVELAPHGITVNALCPGYVDTELTRQNNSPADLEKICATIPAGRLASTAEMARVAAFLCSDASSYLTGQMLVVDGGFSCR